MANPFVAALIGVVLWSVAGASVGADERAVLAFEVPPANMQMKPEKLLCRDALDVTKILADPSLYKALLGVEPTAKREFDSDAAVLQQLEKYARATKGLVVHREGDTLAQCRSGCAVLPLGARVREITLSDRHAGPGASMTGFDVRHDPPKGSETPGSGSATDFVNMGDYGYQGLRITRGERAVCVTAMNWSASETSMQIVKIFFDR